MGVHCRERFGRGEIVDNDRLPARADFEAFSYQSIGEPEMSLLRITFEEALRSQPSPVKFPLIQAPSLVFVGHTHSPTRATKLECSTGDCWYIGRILERDALQEEVRLFGESVASCL